MIPVGLRVDVDTLRGTRVGVPNLTALLRRHKVEASFFFSVGPDNMGRHLWRLLRPRFLFKMLRTRAASLYGWDILLRGTFGPGPSIGKRCEATIRETAEAGHEVGLHAWDHHYWQTKIGRLSQAAAAHEIKRGFDALQNILSEAPACFAAPAWRVTPAAMQALDTFPFRYTSTCRGHSIFRPVVEGHTLQHREVPTTLPTYDEIIGQQCTQASYNAYLLNLIQPSQLNVLTIHAEVEGISCLALFEDFLVQAKARGLVFKPLGALLPATEEVAESSIDQQIFEGREGWMAVQLRAKPATEEFRV